MEDMFDFEMNNIPKAAGSELNDYVLYIESYNVNGKKAFRCTFNNCGKTFKYKSDISRHSLIHSNVRPYYCPYEGCKKSFKRPDVLDGHIRTHTRQLPFECEEPGCNARFTSNAGLKYHLLKHKGQKPFQCTYEGCGRSFMTLAQLKQHESALKYHKNTATPTPARSEEEVVSKVTVLETKEKKDDSEFYMPKPRAAKTLTWEIKNPDELDEVPVKEAEPEPKNDIYDFERIMTYFVQENKALKQKLEECNNKLMNYKEDDVVYNYQSQYVEAPTSPALYELNGFKSPLQQVDMTTFRVYDEAPLNFFDFMKGGNCSPYAM